MDNPEQPAEVSGTNGLLLERIVVVGASAGGTEALEDLVAQIPANFPGCVLIVRHLAPSGSGQYIAHRLARRASLACREATDGEPLVPGTIYVAPSDRHLLVDSNKIWVTRGPRENRWRPSIDVLFRSAAVSHGPRTIGVILSGLLDDGVAGLLAIKRCGGIAIVQDPDDATFPDLPSNAIRSVEIDHRVASHSLGIALKSALQQPPADYEAPPSELIVENRISARGSHGMHIMDSIGRRSPLTCPDCSGTLWKIGEGDLLRFRCHTGHAYSGESLAAAQAEKLEETLWVALRLMQERKQTVEKLAPYGIQTSTQARVDEMNEQIEVLKDVLLGKSQEGRADRANVDLPAG